ANPFTLNPNAKKLETVHDRIDFEVVVAPKEGRRGETVRLTITGIPRPGFYTYPLTKRTADQPDVQLSSLAYDNLPPGIQPLWPVEESEPTVENVPDLGLYLKHKKKFTWSQDLLLLPEATPGPKKVPLNVKLQVCDENSCLQGTISLDVPVEVSAAPAVELAPQLRERM